MFDSMYIFLEIPMDDEVSKLRVEVMNVEVYIFLIVLSSLMMKVGGHYSCYIVVITRVIN